MHFSKINTDWYVHYKHSYTYCTLFYFADLYELNAYKLFVSIQKISTKLFSSRVYTHVYKVYTMFITEA